MGSRESSGIVKSPKWKSMESHVVLDDKIGPKWILECFRKP